MLFVVEGTDGTGKSTLAGALAREVRRVRPSENITRFHFGPPQIHPLTEYERVLDAYSPGQGRTVICDRLHWGEMVFSEIYRGGSKLGPAGFFHVEQGLRTKGATMIHATGDPDVLRSRLDDTDYLKAPHALEAWERFNAVAKMSYQHVRTWDTTGVPGTTTGTSTITDLVEHAAKLEAITSVYGKVAPSYVGPLRPWLLLVGDRPNEFAKNRPRGHRSAFVPYPESSGHYLLDAAILPLPRGRQEIGLVNSYDNVLGESIDLQVLWGMLGYPEVCALGSTANDRLTSQNVPHRSTYHPQYWRRFHHHETYSYRELVTGLRVP